MIAKPRNVIPKNVDEYLTFLAKYPGEAPEAKLMNPVWHIHLGEAPEVDVPVSFNLLLNLVSASNSERGQMATLIQDDLKAAGIRADVAPLEFRSLLDRVQKTYDYDACVLGFGSPDADPNVEMGVWLSSGPNHLWQLRREAPPAATPTRAVWASTPGRPFTTSPRTSPRRRWSGRARHRGHATRGRPAIA